MNDIGNVFSPGKLISSSWNRYLIPRSSLCVVGRSRSYSDSLGWVLSDREFVNFNLFGAKRGMFLSLLNPYSGINLKLKELVINSDAVILRMPSRIGHAVAAICRSLGKKYAVEVVGCVLDSYSTYGNPIYKMLAGIAYREMQTDVLNAATAVYVTKYYLQERYKCRGVVASISNVDLLSDQAMRCSDRGFAAPRKIKVGFVGDVNLRYKGFYTLQKALLSLSPVFSSNIALEVVGPLPTTDTMPYVLHNSDFAQHLGLMKREALMRWLSTVDIFVCPSLTEGLPRALIEAMYSGCLCLGTRVGGIPELLEDKNLFEAKDFETLASLILKYSMTPDYISTEGARNREFAKTNFSSDKLEADRSRFWVNYYTALLSLNSEAVKEIGA